jgi:hypothetical protein
MSSGRLGLLTAFMSIPSHLEDEWNDWYNTDHVPEQMKVPGLLNTLRYKAIEADVPYLCAYKLEAPEVLKTAEYLEYRVQPEQRVALNLHDLTMGTYRLIHTHPEFFEPGERPVDSTTVDNDRPRH